MVVMDDGWMVNVNVNGGKMGSLLRRSDESVISIPSTPITYFGASLPKSPRLVAARYAAAT